MGEFDHFDYDQFPPQDGFSTSYLKLSRDGWVYDGLHHAGGGMGCHVCHEFVHPKYGRLAFHAAISHMADGTPEWRECEQSHPFLQYEEWFLMLDGEEYDYSFAQPQKVCRVDSGICLEELDEVLSTALLEEDGMEALLDFQEEYAAYLPVERNEATIRY